MRSAYDIALEFVQEQSQGEWGEDLELRDAVKLAALIEADRDAIRAEVYPRADATT